MATESRAVACRSPPCLRWSGPLSSVSATRLTTSKTSACGSTPKGRKWKAQLDRDDNNMVLRIELSRVQTAYSENISTALLGTDSPFAHIEKAMLELDRLIR